MTTKKVCFFNSTKRWGGGEKWHFEMAVELANKGLDVFVVSGQKSDLAAKLHASTVNYTEVSIGNLSFLNPFKLFFLKQLLLKEQVDQLILNLPADLKTVGLAAKWAGVSRIIYRRGSAIPIKNTWFNRFLFRHVVTEVLANSAATKKTILENNSQLIHPSKITVVYNGIHTNPAPADRVDKKQAKLVLGVASRMVHQKGYDYLMEIAAVLKQTRSDFILKIAGNGQLEEKIRQWVAEKQLQSCIEFVGFANDMNAFMQSIDVFLLPSRWEGFGYVLAEAMLNKRPIVAFDISSNPELVVHGKNGFLCKPFDTTNFAAKITELLDNSVLRDQQGKCGYEMVIEKFSFQVSVKKLMEFLAN